MHDAFLRPSDDVGDGCLSPQNAWRLDGGRQADRRLGCGSRHSFLAEEKDSPLTLTYIEKDVCAFGIQLDQPHDNLWDRENSFGKTMMAIFQAKITFAADSSEVARLGIDLSEVRIEYMEDGALLRKNPEPTLLMG